jgi:TetR/AcrR family transcriptional repressor of mexCD-oprJ operon
MGDSVTDHRRATAERNVEAILDAAQAALERGSRISISAVAGEAGVSRVTVYAHFAGLDELLAAVVERAVRQATAAIEAAEPEKGPPLEALDRVIAAAWRELDRNRAVAQATSEHLGAVEVARAHEPAMRPIRELVARGRREGAFRADVPEQWLVTACFALLHACGDEVRAGRMDAERALEVVTTTMRDVFAGGGPRPVSP